MVLKFLNKIIIISPQWGYRRSDVDMGEKKKKVVYKN